MALEAQNNPFTSVLMVEAADVEALPDADPAAGQRRLAVGPDHLLYLVSNAGVKTLVGGSGIANPLATDSLWDAAGDLVQGSGANTAAKLGAGTAGKVLTSNGAAAALTWETPAAAGAMATDVLWDAKGDLAAGTGANTGAKLTAGANDTILMADSGQSTGLKWVASQTPSTQAFSDAAAEGTADTYARGDHKHGMMASPGGGLASVDSVPSSPNAADIEFSAYSGWTNLGTPTSANITGYPGYLYLSKTGTGTFQVHGIYRAIPSMPFTMTAKIQYPLTTTAAYQTIGLMLAESSPGKLAIYGPMGDATTGAYAMTHSEWTNRTTRSAFASTASGVHPSYLRLVVASSTDVSFLVSDDGIVWKTTLWASLNPGFTIGNYGIAVTGQDNSVNMAGTVMYVRFT